MVLFELKTIKGVIVDSYGKNAQLQSNSSSDVALNNLKITQTNGDIKTVGDLVYGGDTYDLSLSGSLYPEKGKGVYAGKVVHGDMQETKDFNILQFRIEKDSSTTGLLKTNRNLFEGQTVLTMVLEDKKSGERIYFQDTIQEREFESLFKGAECLVDKKDLNEDELKRKVAKLSNINNKSDYSEQIPESMQFETEGIDSEGKITSSSFDSAAVNISVDRAELVRLLKDLKSKGSVSLSDYNVPESLFKDDGWKKYSNLGTKPRYFWHAASADQGDFTLTQISYFEVI